MNENDKNNTESKEILYKIVTFLNREELDFLDNIVKDIFFVKGNKTPRSQVVREIIQMALHLNSFGKTIIDELAKKPEIIQKENSDKKEAVSKRRPL